MKKLFFGSSIVASSFVVSDAYAEWTPLITSTAFSGIQTDTLTAAAGIVSLVLIVLGIGILIKVFL